MFWKLLWPVGLLALLPLGVSWFVYPNHLPPKFGVFPPQFVTASPPFLWWYFLLVAAVAIALSLLFVHPKLYRINGGPPEARQPSSISFPLWFWLGGAVMLVSWWLMWARPVALAAIVPYAFSPLWWGFIFLLDGIVYKRNNGASLFATKRKLFVITVFVSLIGWLFFEYFDYFVLESWYYPQANILPYKLTVVVFLLAYTTVWPAVFEWYNLLNTFPNIVARFKNGPRLIVRGKSMLFVGYVLVIVMVIWPWSFFWAVWIGPTLVFTGLLTLCGIGNPCSDLAKGNWAPILLIALACFLNGFVWEIWNYGSTHPVNPITNPNYWDYDIPYVNVGHFFSEMPALGYFGYMPFGLLVWQFSIWAGELCGYNSDISLRQNP